MFENAAYNVCFPFVHVCFLCVFLFENATYDTSFVFLYEYVVFYSLVLARFFCHVLETVVWYHSVPRYYNRFEFNINVSKVLTFQDRVVCN